MVENATGFVLERADMEWFWSLCDPDGCAAQDPRADRSRSTSKGSSGVGDDRRARPAAR